MSTNESLDALKAALGDSAELRKSITTSNNLVNIDLQAPAKKLYPVLTPLRNSIPRVQGEGGLSTQWRSITGLNTAGVVGLVGEGQRGGSVTTTSTDVTASYKTIGLDDSLTYEARSAAEGFDDMLARMTEGLLRGTMVEEEKILLGGNNSVAFGTTPTPSLSQAATGGGLSDGAVYVVCVALTHQAWRTSSVGATGVPVAASRTNADGTTVTINGGAAQKSAEATITLNGGGSAQVVKASVTAVAGAAGYAWYIGATGQTKLVAITTINSVVITALPDSGNQNCGSLFTADKSQETLAFDGLATQCFKSASGAYTLKLATGTAGTGTILTSDGAAGITEINTALASFWDSYKMGPDEIWVSGTMFTVMNKLMLANGSAPLIRLTESAAAQGVTADLLMSRRVGSYQNPITGDIIKINVHPYMPSSWILFRSTRIPYQFSNVGAPLEVKTRRDYYSIQFPQTSRTYPIGVYAEQVLANYFPPAFGLITNVATGKGDGT